MKAMLCEVADLSLVYKYQRKRHEYRLVSEISIIFKIHLSDWAFFIIAKSYVKRKYNCKSILTSFVALQIKLELKESIVLVAESVPKNTNGLI